MACGLFIPIRHGVSSAAWKAVEGNMETSKLATFQVSHELAFRPRMLEGQVRVGGVKR